MVMIMIECDLLTKKYDFRVPCMYPALAYMSDRSDNVIDEGFLNNVSIIFYVVNDYITQSTVCPFWYHASLESAT